jgi:hypothetical protein
MMRSGCAGSALRRPTGGRCAQHASAACAALVTFLVAACGGAQAPRAKRSPEAVKVSPPPRSVLVQADSVVIEGRWYPVAAGPNARASPNAVRVLCARAERTCREDLTRLSAHPDAEPFREVLQYRVREWTKEGTPAGKLVASRREGATEIEIRVSLSGLAAEKVVIDKGGETRWRLE